MKDKITEIMTEKISIKLERRYADIIASSLTVFLIDNKKWLTQESEETIKKIIKIMKNSILNTGERA